MARNGSEGCEMCIKVHIDDGPKKGKVRIYPERRRAKPSWTRVLVLLTYIWICITLLGIPKEISFVFVFGLYFIYKRKIETELRELAEFRKTHTVNGFRAHQVFGNDPRDFRWAIIVFGFPFSYYLHYVLQLTESQSQIVFLVTMFILMMANTFAIRLRTKYA